MRKIQIGCTLFLMLILMGCGNTKVQETEEKSVEEKQESVVQENVQDDEADKKETGEKAAETESGELESETALKESVEAQTTTNVADIDAFVQYMTTLDPAKAAVVIYNEETGDVTNIKNEQTYQLKDSDRIFLSHSEDIKSHVSSGTLSFETAVDSHCVYSTNGHYAKTGVVMEGYENILCAWEVVPDYSEYNDGELVESYYGIWTHEYNSDEWDDIIGIYLIKP